ncbi:MAG: DMT family transporter [Ruminococcaceae bacterium]|nr:DMT family transporter [Oscillospiraceae bacterium]
MKKLSELLRSKNDLTIGIICCLIGNVFYGFSYMFTRVAQRSAVPEVQLALRFVIAFILMTILLLVRHQMPSLKGRRKWPLIVCAFSVLSIYYTESLGIYYSNSSFASLSLSILPVVALILAFIFLKERPTRRQVIFSFFPVIGVVLITLANSNMGAVRPIGIIMMAICILVSAVSRVINRKYSIEYSSAERTYTILFFGSISFTITALITVKGDLSAFTYALSQPSFLASTLALSILCSIIALFLVNYSYSKLSVVRISAINTVSTVVGVLAGIILLREPVNALSAFGSVLTIFGIWQVNSSGQREQIPQVNTSGKADA